ncbi:MAG: sigma 54-interacting transcriptional regulator [Polyangia bacterium]|nr:sigma 54-interacting transcriptional regulator [Polyangia bacterium]
MTRVTNQAARGASVPGALIRVLDGPDAPLEASIPPVGLVVGADPTADFPLTDQAVSGRHLAVTPREGGFEVTDLGSRNGTFLDGAALQKAMVPMGALLRLGRTLVQLLPAEELLDIPPSDSSSFGELVGGSLPMRRVFALLERASLTDASVLLLGESGTGKELAARAVHEHSPRAKGPFVVFDCGAASDTLMSSDLFGHVRGAFTGADRDRQGAFASAHQGTLFLDEIGDLPLELQPKLLRLLEAGEVTPLGATRRERYDVRVVAATHRDLWQEVSRGSFRGDLYYRLSVVEVHLPPLRQRLEDIPLLVPIFMRRAGGQAPPVEKAMAKATATTKATATGTATATEVALGLAVEGPNLSRLLAYSWPGNVRELRNVISRAVALGPPGASFDRLPILLHPASTVGPGPGPGSTPGPNSAMTARADRPFHEAKAELVARFERAYLMDLLERSGGNHSAAARAAGVERKYLYELLGKHGLGK